MIALLKKKRTKKELSLSQLASRIGITKGYLSQIENYPHTCNPTINLIFKLSEELELSPYRVLYYFKKHKNF